MHRRLPRRPTRDTLLATPSSVWNVITSGTPYLAYDVNVEASRTVSGGRLTECLPFLGGVPANDLLAEWSGYVAPTFTAADARFGNLSSCSRIAAVGTLRSLVSASAILASQPYWLFVIGVEPAASRWICSASTAGTENSFIENSSSNLRAHADNYITLAAVDTTQGVLLAMKFDGASTTGFIRKADGTETAISGNPGAYGWRGFILFSSTTGPGAGDATAMAWSLYQNDVSADDLTGLRTWCQTEMGWS